MSLFASFGKKSKLHAAIRKAAKARTSDSADADQLYREVFQDYADVLTGDPLRAAALYQWGVALLHQAKNKTPPESINIFRNAIAKFSFCMTIDPNYLAAAIDAGVACMDLARARAVPVTDELYEMAKRQFEKANSIQAGVAAYNLACIHGLRGENDDCLAMLTKAKENGSLPDEDVIMSDPDMAQVVKQKWFKDFIAAIDEEKKQAAEKLKAEKEAAEAAKKAEKDRKDKAYDPYRAKAPKDEESGKKSKSKEPVAETEASGQDNEASED